MKKTIAGITLAGTLVAGALGGYTLGQHQTIEQMGNKQMVMAQQQKAQMMQLAKMMQQKEKYVMQLEKQTAEVYDGAERLIGNPGEPDIISESFEIIEVADGHVRGEKMTGTGEGIYYEVSQLKEMGFNPTVGDKIRVGWNENDYNDENWDNIAMVERLK